LLLVTALLAHSAASSAPLHTLLRSGGVSMCGIAGHERAPVEQQPAISSAAITNASKRSMFCGDEVRLRFFNLQQFKWCITADGRHTAPATPIRHECGTASARAAAVCPCTARQLQLQPNPYRQCFTALFVVVCCVMSIRQSHLKPVQTDGGVCQRQQTAHERCSTGSIAKHTTQTPDLHPSPLSREVQWMGSLGCEAAVIQIRQI